MRVILNHVVASRKRLARLPPLDHRALRARFLPTKQIEAKASVIRTPKSFPPLVAILTSTFTKYVSIIFDFS